MFSCLHPRFPSYILEEMRHCVSRFIVEADVSDRKEHDHHRFSSVLVTIDAG